MKNLTTLTLIASGIHVLLKHLTSSNEKEMVGINVGGIPREHALNSEKESINKYREFTSEYDSYKLGYFANAVNEKIKEVEDSISVKSLRDKANTASEFVDLKTIKKIDDLESSLHQKPTSHETSLINGCDCVGRLSVFDIPDNEEVTVFVEHTDVVNKRYFSDYIIALLGRLAYLIELQSKFLHLSRYLDSLVKHVTSKARQFHYQISSLFLALFHYIDITHNDNVSELNTMKLSFIYSLKNYHEFNQKYNRRA